MILFVEKKRPCVFYSSLYIFIMMYLKKVLTFFDDISDLVLFSPQKSLNNIC